MREVRPLIRDLWLVVGETRPLRKRKKGIRTTKKRDFIGFLPISKRKLLRLEKSETHADSSHPIRWKKRRSGALRLRRCACWMNVPLGGSACCGSAVAASGAPMWSGAEYLLDCRCGAYAGHYGVTVAAKSATRRDRARLALGVAHPDAEPALIGDVALGELL